MYTLLLKMVPICVSKFFGLFTGITYRLGSFLSLQNFFLVKVGSVGTNYIFRPTSVFTVVVYTYRPKSLFINT